MGKLFQSEWSNTLLQYFATEEKKNSKGGLSVPKITAFHSPQDKKGLHSVVDYNMCTTYVKNLCSLNKREPLRIISKQGSCSVP